MKLIVKETFRDKTDMLTIYATGNVIKVNDESRAANLIERGLCAEYKGKKTADFALSDSGPVKTKEITKQER